MTLVRIPPTIRFPSEAPMPFLIRPSRRFPVQCAVTYNAGVLFGFWVSEAY